jgi:hypothetical protein
MMQLQVVGKAQHGQQHCVQKQMQHHFQHLEHAKVKMFKSTSTALTKQLFAIIWQQLYFNKNLTCQSGLYILVLVWPAVDHKGLSHSAVFCPPSPT